MINYLSLNYRGAWRVYHYKIAIYYVAISISIRKVFFVFLFPKNNVSMRLSSDLNCLLYHELNYI